MGVPIDRTFFFTRNELVAEKTPILDMRGRAGGGIIALSNLSEPATVTFEVGAKSDDLYPLEDGAGSAVSVSISAGKACAIPEDAMKFAYIQLTFSGVGTVTGTVVVVGKS